MIMKLSTRASTHMPRWTRRKTRRRTAKPSSSTRPLRRSFMNTPTDVQKQADALRREVAGILEEMEAQADDFELPKPPEAFGLFREKLRENTYNVLVAGE